MYQDWMEKTPVLGDIESELEKKDKIINEMAEEILKLDKKKINI